MTQTSPLKNGRILQRMAYVAVVVVLLGGGYYGFCMRETVRNAYAASWVASMVVEHLRSNNNQWPRSWDELKDDYETCTARSGRPWTFEELSTRTIVDWQADPKELLTLSADRETEQFQVIKLADGSDDHWRRQNPNQMILEYLRLNLATDQR